MSFEYFSKLEDGKLSSEDYETILQQFITEGSLGCYAFEEYFKSKVRILSLQHIENILNNLIDHPVLYADCIKTFDDVLYSEYIHDIDKNKLYYFLNKEKAYEHRLLFRVLYHLALGTPVNISKLIIEDIIDNSDYDLPFILFELAEAYSTYHAAHKLMSLLSLYDNEIKYNLLSLDPVSKLSQSICLMLGDIDFFTYVSSRLNDNSPICLSLRASDTFPFSIREEVKRLLFQSHIHVPLTIEFLLASAIKTNHYPFIIDLAEILPKKRILKILLDKKDDTFINLFIERYKTNEELGKFVPFI